MRVATPADGSAIEALMRVVCAFADAVERTAALGVERRAAAGRVVWVEQAGRRWVLMDLELVRLVAASDADILRRLTAAGAARVDVPVL